MRYWLLFLFLAFPSFVFSHSEPVVADTARSTFQISILTCGMGSELYASFGHTGVRVVDYVTGRDDVYNYGTFNFSDPDFYSKFVSGKLLYYLDKSSYSNFMGTYVEERRNVREQVLALPAKEAAAFVAFLEWNLLPENSSYPYDFLFDNCATRVRDLFPKLLGEVFYFGENLEDKKISYRNIINQYLSHKHWERFGINLLLGSRVDSIMTTEGSMFLPEFLYKGLVHAQYKGKHVVAEEKTLLDHKIILNRSFNGPMWLMVAILVLVVLSFHVKSFFYLKSVVRFVILAVTGLLGLFMIFMWLGTNHQSCADNYNVLWAIPFNIITAFFAGGKRSWLKIYALAAISLLIVALAVHVIGLQRMPLIELSPLLICLMYIYVDLYKANVTLATSPENKQAPNI